MPRVLLLYYTYTQRARRVADVMAETFRARGIDVQQAAIEFTDPRYVERFSRFPFRRPYIDLFGMFPPQLQRRHGPSPRPGRRNPGQLRPRLHRLAHSVGDHQHGGPFVPGV
jgi:hypothetical protein